MNRIRAVVKRIQQVENLSVVTFTFQEEELNMMSLDLAADVKEGSEVLLSVKSSHVSIGKALEGMLSTSNRLDAVVKSVHDGELLSSVTLAIGDAVTLESIITRASSRRMGLQAGDRVMALIKASDLSIAEVCHG